MSALPLWPMLMVLAAVFTLASGCGGGEARLDFLDGVTVEGPAPDVTLAASALELRALPQPDLDTMDPLVRAQLGEEQAALRRLAERAEVTVGELGEAYGQMGMHYLVYGFDEASRLALLNARELVPREPRWHYYLARLAEKQGDPEAAAEGYLRVLALRREDLTALVRLAEIDRKQGRPERAEILFRAALALDDSCAAAHFGLGRIASSRARFRQAIDHFGAALQATRQQGPVHYALGMAYRGLGDMQRAAAHLARSSPGEVAPADPYRVEVEKLKRGAGLLYRRGVTLLGRDEPQAALRAFRRVLQIDPEHQGVRTSIAVALSELGDLEGAIAMYRTVLERQPHRAEAHYNLGLLLRDQGRLSDAIERFAAAVHHAPQDPDARIQLALALLRLGRDEEALRHLPEVIANEPRMAGAHLLQGLTLSRAGRHREALQRLETAHGFFPAVWQIEDALARLLAGSPDAALRDGPRALAIARGAEQRGEPNGLQAQTLAMALAATGDYREAVRWQERALVLSRDSATSSLSFIEDNLARYRRGASCERPWPEDDPIVYPLP